ncbi:IS3 family transposase [Cellulomonas sp. WB94]|uniref:IS3 family transposase n=1 Tax=Cellulomonas sp. WB94 TaxID=2173174 RepID=UPI000D56F1CD|nr:IS3 family transposase [Cellulomonas sp. WB94]PVU81405.1 IS3 family transposase [Cellulomonas sp. WB94]PVU82575.1 IS3 family transposase [Cellulomonas sp. WB94]PVU82702.1 IS3 family transposase [Cellulomonas sp. WB94]PVU82749.1 IS3 family transposase [Cellulomonas sp. WB94]
MARKTYSAEFRRDAVELYRSTPTATVAGIAADLGIMDTTLSGWIKAAGVAIRGQSRPASTAPPPGETPEQELVRLRSRVRELEDSERKLSTEREILRAAAKYFGRGDELVSRFQFVADHQSTFEVKRLCQVVQVARSSFYKWLSAAPARAARQTADAALAARIAAVHATDSACGAPRITAELNDGAGEQERVNHKRVARVMRAHHIAGIRLRRRVRTTVPDPDGQLVPDLLERDFTAHAPNTKYVGDITYLPCGAGQFLYLATVIDCYSRRLVGWSIADHMRTDLVADALRAAARERGSLAGAIFHSDHGGQYVAKDYTALCERLGVTRSMGAVGTSADNAMAESFNASLKRETLAGSHGWPDATTARRVVFAWITRYNTRRRHSYCDYLSPITYENTHYAATLATAA